VRAIGVFGLAIVILVGTVIAMVNTHRRIPAPLFGASVSALLGLAIVSLVTDMIPDDVEVAWAGMTVVGAIAVSGLAWLASGRHDEL
jgi:hypothetical protein